jgi:hypothetical protein
MKQSMSRVLGGDEIVFEPEYDALQTCIRMMRQKNRRLISDIATSRKQCLFCNLLIALVQSYKQFNHMLNIESYIEPNGPGTTDIHLYFCDETGYELARENTGVYDTATGIINNAE